MTTGLTFVQAVRDYIDITSSSGNAAAAFSDQSIGSNIKAATEFLERATKRYFYDRPGVTLTFTSEGRAEVPIPGLRTATTVTMASAARTANSSYWLLPDYQQSGVSLAIALRAFTNRTDGPAYLGYPEWFDRNYDSPKWSFSRGSLPNDLVILGDWGYTDALMPDAARHACKVLAAYYTLRPNSLLSGATQTPGGSFYDLSSLPVEVADFIQNWRAGEQAVTVGAGW